MGQTYGDCYSCDSCRYALSFGRTLKYATSKSTSDSDTGVPCIFRSKSVDTSQERV